MNLERDAGSPLNRTSQGVRPSCIEQAAAIRTRTRQTFTISLPRDLAEEIDRVARAESRSRSELLREAFRQYVQRRQRWEAIFAYGEAKGSELGLRSEEDVARRLEESQQERPGKRSDAG